MDQLPQFGTEISSIVQPTFKTYIPILLKNVQKIKSTTRKSFSYGANDRQQLDVYYPASDTAKTNDSILIFMYGGGLVRGDRILSAVPEGLAYANIGHFFAEKCGYTVVIPDYRLISHGAKFPSGGEDLALVVDWVLSNLAEDGRQRNLFMMGNSAGGVHMSTYLFAEEFVDHRRKVLGPETGGNALRLRAVTELSVPCHFQYADPSRKEVLDTYFDDRIDERCPMGLLRSMKKKTGIAKGLPGVGVLVMYSTLDPEDEIVSPNKDFIATWSEGQTDDAAQLKVEIIQGHNHLSPPLSLGTDDEKEEEWAHQVSAFFNSVVQKQVEVELQM